MLNGHQGAGEARRTGYRGRFPGFSALRGVGGFFLLLFLLRTFFLLAALDPSQERVMEVLDRVPGTWTQGPERPLYDREELYTATAAEAILHRLPLRWGDYRFMPYASGSLLTALAAVPLYALFGPDYWTFKTLALMTSVLAGLFWFLFARRWIGLGGAWLFGALYLFAPTVLIRTSLIAKGDHPEAMMILGAIAYLATRAIQARSDTGRRPWAVACGALAGLGVYVTYAVLPVLLAAGCVMLVATRLRPWRAWMLFAVGLLAGLLPWLVFLAQTGSGVLHVYRTVPGSAIDGAEAWRRAQMLFDSGLRASYDLPGWAARHAAGLLWTAAALLGGITLLLASVRPRRREPRIRILAAVVLAAVCTHLASFCLVAPDASSRYLIPVYPLLLFGLTLAAQRQRSKGEPGEREDAWRRRQGASARGCRRCSPRADDGPGGASRRGA